MFRFRLPSKLMAVILHALSLSSTPASLLWAIGRLWHFRLAACPHSGCWARKWSLEWSLKALEMHPKKPSNETETNPETNPEALWHSFLTRNPLVSVPTVTLSLSLTPLSHSHSPTGCVATGCAATGCKPSQPKRALETKRKRKHKRKYKRTEHSFLIGRSAERSRTRNKLK